MPLQEITEKSMEPYCLKFKLQKLLRHFGGNRKCAGIWSLDVFRLITFRLVMTYLCLNTNISTQVLKRYEEGNGSHLNKISKGKNAYHFTEIWREPYFNEKGMGETKGTKRNIAHTIKIQQTYWLITRLPIE